MELMEIMSSIDSLPISEALKKVIHAHLNELGKEIDALRAENEEIKADRQHWFDQFESICKENDQLKIRVEKLREAAINAVNDHDLQCEDANGNLSNLAEALAQDDEREKE